MQKKFFLQEQIVLRAKQTSPFEDKAQLKHGNTSLSFSFVSPAGRSSSWGYPDYDIDEDIQPPRLPPFFFFFFNPEEMQINLTLSSYSPAWSKRIGEVVSSKMQVREIQIKPFRNPGTKNTSPASETP